MPVTAQQIIDSIPNRFRPEKAQGYSAVIHFDISGGETLQYTVDIKNAQCILSKGHTGVPDCVIAAKASMYVDLETGKANPQTAFMQGDIKVSNLMAMMQFVKCFRKFEETVSSSQTAQNIQRVKKTGPLAGVKIIDFTRLLPGPLATMFLADLGADVIKIENPDRPDYIRDFEPRLNGISMYYLSLNRSKRSLAVNYLSPEGKELVYDLVKQADVLIEQFRPGVMKELGFGFDELTKINPKLIYVSITGYGQNSHLAMAAGHDVNYIGIAGALGITGNKNGEPVIPGFQLADIAGGSYMAMNAVTTALYQREKTGRGDHVDVAMTDAVLPFTAMQFAYQQALKVEPGRGQFELSGGLANYHVYACADGKYVALGSLEPKFWNGFCARVGRTDWQSRFLKKGEELEQLKQEVASLFLTKTRVEWLSFFKDDDICITAVNGLSELENDRYLNERKMFVEHQDQAGDKYKTINQPLKFQQSNLDKHWDAPALGDDTMQLLKELNYPDERVAALKEKKIIKANGCT